MKNKIQIDNAEIVIESDTSKNLSSLNYTFVLRYKITLNTLAMVTVIKGFKGEVNYIDAIQKSMAMIQNTTDSDFMTQINLYKQPLFENLSKKIREKIGVKMSQWLNEIPINNILIEIDNSIDEQMYVLESYNWKVLKY